MPSKGNSTPFATDIFSNLRPGQKGMAINVSDSGMPCDCLPSCTEQNYGADAFISNRVFGAGIPNTNQFMSNLSSIVVYFKDISCIKYRRELFKTWDDFLASFGGIFGLCLGGSVISLVEIVYFSSFKLFEVIFNDEKKYPNFKSHKKKFDRRKIFGKPFSKRCSNRVLFLK